MEHRWGTRHDLDLPAQLVAGDGTTAPATIRNVSLSGALIHSLLQLPPSSRVVVQPQARPGRGLEAQVVRSDSGGFAVKWLQPGSERALLCHL